MMAVAVAMSMPMAVAVTVPVTVAVSMPVPVAMASKQWKMAESIQLHGRLPDFDAENVKSYLVMA